MQEKPQSRPSVTSVIAAPNPIAIRTVGQAMAEAGDLRPNYDRGGRCRFAGIATPAHVEVGAAAGAAGILGWEPARLARLGLVSPQHEPILDRLTALARGRLGAAVAIMSIVQPELDRQYFKSAAGLESALADARQTPLAHSFCKNVRAADAPFVVLDTATDPRVRGNPAIELYGIASYLGCPIHLSGREPIGALCVMDTVPRNWTDADIALLSRFADLVDQAISFGELVEALETVPTGPDIGQVAAETGSMSLPPPSGSLRGLKEPVAGGATAGGRTPRRTTGPMVAADGPSAVAVPSVRQAQENAGDVAVAAELWRGIAAGNFRPWYQPQVEARTRRIVGAEMLARWCREDGSVSAPGAFLPLAERLSVLDRIDLQVIRRATEDFAVIASGAEPGLELSINLTLKSLFDGEVIELLRRYRSCGHRLSVEILESVSIEELDPTIEWQLEALRDLGIRIGLDDFGSNRSSLLALARARPDYIKIDRRLVEMHTQPQADPGPLRSIIGLAGDFGALVVAEGVETESQAALLARLGADRLQGFHFARPMDVRALEELLNRQGSK